MLNGASPAFDIDAGGALLAILRGCAVAGLLSVFGALLFRSLVAPRAFSGLEEAERSALDRRLRRWIGQSVVVAAGCLLVWLPLEAASVSGAQTASSLLAALRTLAAETGFGHLVLLQLAGLLAVAAVLRARPSFAWAATWLGGLTLALQAGHSHALAMTPEPSLLLASELVHLLAAGAWLGGLWPLLIVVRHAAPRIGALACRHYSPLGKLCLVAMLATAVWQFGELIGGLAGLVGTAYGWVALAKLALFGALFAFALANRYTLAPRLLGSDAEPARRALVRSIAVQTGFGLAVVLAAGLLSQLSPAIHVEPVWPFSVQPSLVTIREDGEFRDEVLRALAALGGAAAIAGLGVVWRTRRWLAALAAAVAAVLTVRAVPHLDLLFVPATPTSFYTSPTGFAATSIVAGAALYPAHCASCHGAEGRGDGPLAKQSAVPPADLTAPHLWDHADGELYGWIAQGMEAPEGGLAMPGFAAVLTGDEIWALIDFIRARNAGLARAAGDAADAPAPAPAFDVSCGSADAVDLASLRGRAIRLVFGTAMPAATDGVVTILAAAGQRAPPGACVADDGSIRAAYAIVAGLPAARLDGAEILIDANGWLRDVRPAGAAADPATLRAIVAKPLAAEADATAHHHH